MMKAIKNSSPYVIIILLICTSLLLSEAALQLFANCRFSVIEYDKRLGWLLKKNNTLEIKAKDQDKRDIKTSFNGRGFRDSDHSFEKDEGTKRIIILGDSYTAGIEYPDDVIFASIFERKLNSTAADNIKYDVMNVSVPAWATDQQYTYLKEEGMKYHPDYVILIIAPNDIRETYGKKFLYLENGDLKETGTTLIPWRARFFWFLANHSCVFQGFQRVFKLDYGSFRSIFQYFPISFPVGAEMCNDKHLHLKETPAEITAAMELFKAILLEINRLCRENHCRLMITVAATKDEFDGSLKDGQYESAKITEYVKSIADENSIPFLDLFSHLQTKEKDPLKIFITWEYHLNDYGHAFVAEELLQFFDSSQDPEPRP